MHILNYSNFVKAQNLIGRPLHSQQVSKKFRITVQERSEKINKPQKFMQVLASNENIDDAVTHI